VSDEIEVLYRRFLSAWNDQDADAMASCFADDGEMIGFDGSHARGSRGVREHLAPIFADHQTAMFVTSVREVRMLSDTVGLLRAAAGMVPPDGSDINPAVNTHHTVVAQKSDDSRWRIALFQNTPARFDGRPEEVERWTEELRAALNDGGGSH
jgi:uncharacterized protein (TIGR02246 family)